MSINIESEAWCRKAYLNYHCYGNTMKISANEMGEITKRWESRLTSWQATVSNDENEYEFDDSDYSTYKDNGKKAAQEQTGYEGGKGNMIGRGVGDAAVTLGTTVASKVAAKAVGKGVVKALGKKAGMKVAKATGEKTGASMAKKVGLWVAATLEAATAATYYAKKPNKPQKEACDELQNVMANNQAALSDTQAEMEDMSAQLIELSDQANEANEEANDKIEEEKTEFDMYRETYEALKAKVESGEPLTEDEKALYQQVVKYMQASGEEITGLQEDATDVVGEIYEDMETYQEGYDYAAETMGEIEGTTDFAESFDSATRTMCYVEGAAQGLNAADAAITTAQLMGSGPWNWAFAAISAAAGVASGIAAAEQFKWAGEVGTEIDLRKNTQDLNTETMDIYTEEIDAYDGFMGGVEDLEIDIPDDVEAPKDTSLPPDTSGLPQGTPEPVKPEDKKDPEL